MRAQSAVVLMAGVVWAGLLAPTARGQAVPELDATACDSFGSKRECALVASCAWVKSCSGTASDPVAHPDCAAGVTSGGDCPDGCDLDETCVVNHGADDCECIDPWAAQAESNAQCLNATLGGDKQEGMVACLPRSYGAGRCGAWDSQMVGVCVDEDGNVPDSGQEAWCQSAWCWVNGSTCQKPRTKSAIEWSDGTAAPDDLFYRLVARRYCCCRYCRTDRYCHYCCCHYCCCRCCPGRPPLLPGAAAPAANRADYADVDANALIL